MSGCRRLAGEVAEHMELYRDLGVRWLSRGCDATRGAPAEGRIAAGTSEPAGAEAGRIGSRVRVGTSQADLFSAGALPPAAETLVQLREALGDCRRCKLAPARTNIVFGSGNPNAELMFVGEAPGADEDEQGLPFVGRAGQLLTRIIEAIDMRRKDVYICNVLKCRPPGNRNPESDEVSSCEPFLLRQIACVNPKVICALGAPSAQTLLRAKESISRLRGQFFDYRGAKLIATFHPAYLLRNPNEKRRVWEDVQKIRDYLRSLRAGGLRR